MFLTDLLKYLFVPITYYGPRFSLPVTHDPSTNSWVLEYRMTRAALPSIACGGGLVIVGGAGAILYGYSLPVSIFIVCGMLLLIAASVRMGSRVIIRFSADGLATREWRTFDVRVKHITNSIESVGVSLSDVQFSRPRMPITYGCHLYGLGSELLIAAGPRDELAAYVLDLPGFLRETVLDSKVTRYGVTMPLF